jgi:hypothetical protein
VARAKKAKKAARSGRQKKVARRGRAATAKKVQRVRKTTFLDQLRRTGNVTVACAQSGVPRTVVYEWRSEDIDFKIGWEQAIDEAADLMEAEAWRRGVQGVTREIYHQGAVVGSEQVYSDALLIFLLKAARPHKFRERFEVALKDPLSALAEATGLSQHEIIVAVREINERKLLPETTET